MLREGLRNIEQILRNIIRNPGLQLDTFRIKEDIYSDDYKVLLWRNRELFGPITITQSKIVDCAETLHGYLEMERILREEIEKRIWWQNDRP